MVKVARYAFPLVVVASLASAAFGFSMMSHGGTHTFSCILAGTDGTNCMTLGGAFEYTISHVGAFVSFASADFGTSAALWALFLAFAVLLLHFDREARFAFVPLERGTLSQPVISFEPFRRWLALREKRDPLVSTCA